MPQFGRGKPAAGAFYDSDFSTIDNVLAVSLLFGLQNNNDCRVAILTVSRANLAVTGFVDAVERFYHGPAANFAQLPPIGMRTEGTPGETPAGFNEPAGKNFVKSVIDTADPVTLIRNYLQAQQDQNGFFVLAGPATNLAALLKYPGIKPLIATKLKHLTFAAGDAHIKADIPAAKKIFAEWPTPIYMVGTDVGAALPFPGASIDKEFAETAPEHPVADAYRAYGKMPYDAPSQSMAAALYAARPMEGYFKLSGPGTVAVDDAGRTSFTAVEKGTHQTVLLDPAQKEKILKAYVELASAKPAVARRGRGPAVDTPPPPPAKKDKLQ
jgi:inosine-uridine nucleoside N-ribohydrolase